jgi:hypothetical protein
MVKKKLIEIVVCSALLLGDCMANGSASGNQSVAAASWDDLKARY